MPHHRPQGEPAAAASRDLTPAMGQPPMAFPFAPLLHPGAAAASAHRRLWGLLVRRRWTLIAALLAALGITLGISLLPAPLYRSAVLLQIEADAVPTGRPPGTPAAPAGPPETGASRDYFQTQCALLQSRTLARRVIDQLDLGTSGALAPAAGWPLIADLAGRLRARLPGLGTPAPPDGGAAIAADQEDRFLARLGVTPVGDSQLVRITFDSPDPREAAAVVQTLAENFVTGALKRRHQASAPASAFLEHRVRRAAGELADAERRLAALGRELGIVDLEAQRALLLGRLRALDAAQSAAELARLAPDTAPGPAGADADTEPDGTAAAIRSLEERKAALSAEYQEQSKVFKPGYPKVAQLRRALADIERQLRAQATTAASAARAGAATRAQQESRLGTRAEALKTELYELTERGNGYRVLERDLERQRRIHDQLVARLAEVRAHADPGRSPIAIIDRAQVPTHPWRPDLPVNLGLGAALGLLGGLLLAWLRDGLDDRLRDAATLEHRIGLPVLGQVPRSRGPRWRGAAGPAALRPWQEPGGALAEAFRSLRTALLFITPAGAPRVLHFTSASAGEGKTTAACATAIAFAETGSRVLLVDANLRRPALHRVFGLPNDTGLATGLAASDAARSPQPPQPTAVPNLWVLTAGPPPALPAECLSSPHLDAWLTGLAPRFDLLILDGPPVAELADAVLLAHQADATLLIAASGRTRLPDLTAALRRLRTGGCPPLGAVLTGGDA